MLARSRLELFLHLPSERSRARLFYDLENFRTRVKCAFLSARIPEEPLRRDNRLFDIRVDHGAWFDGGKFVSDLVSQP